MARRGSIQVEWFNVSYRTVGLAVSAVVLVLGGVAGYWLYFQRYGPREEATAAIERAESRLAEASRVEGDAQVARILEGAKHALDDARVEFEALRFPQARVQAIRSENLSQRALTIAQGTESDVRMVRFYKIEGDVRVKQVGQFSWETADPKMILEVGDQVKTSSSASAELIYFDGTLTTIKPGSLLEIRDLYEDPVTRVRRVREKLNWGELKASTQKRNVRGSYHEVTTDTTAARADDAGEFRVSFDRDKMTAEFDVFDGRIEVAGPSSKQTVDAGERVRAAADGRLAAKESLPGVPRLVSPSDQRVFILENPFEEGFNLTWEPVAGSTRYRLIISDKSLFTQPLYDAEREGTSAALDGVAPGSYYWKVAAISRSGVLGPFSDARRFRVSSQQIRDRTDSVPPALEITEFVPIGPMVIVNGKTEPGANLWVDQEKVDVDEDGTFYAVVRMRQEGLNEIHFVAQDTAGNEARLQKSAYVEFY